jgi:hypothetical protein
LAHVGGPPAPASIFEQRAPPDIPLGGAKPLFKGLDDGAEQSRGMLKL